MLTCKRISKHFGNNVALSDVDLEIAAGEIVSVIGPNGSGKSTLVNVISGLYTPDAGAVTLGDKDITGRSPQHIRHLGLARTFQNLRLFEDLTLIDNMLLGLHLELLGPRGTVGAMLACQFRPPKYRQQERKARERAEQALESVGLADRPQIQVSAMSYGERKRAELAQALLAAPKLLLLDEPTAGLSPAEADEMRDIFTIPARERGMAVLLVEHRLEWVLSVSDRVVVLDVGQKIADGQPHDVARNEEVRKVYIGE